MQSPRVSIGLSPQPDVLYGLAHNPGFLGRGLLGRFLYFLPPSPIGYRDFSDSPIPEQYKIEYHANIKRMLDWPVALDAMDHPILHVLTLSNEAATLWLSYALEIETQMRPQQVLAAHQDWGGKAPGAAARVAAILHCMEELPDQPWHSPISAHTMEAAIALMRDVQDHSLCAMTLMGANIAISHAMMVWAWIEKQPTHHGITERTIFNALRATFSTMEPLRTALSLLIERGYIRYAAQKNSTNSPGRKPSKAIEVRPELCRITESKY